jgi:hypothetical protein
MWITLLPQEIKRSLKIANGFCHDLQELIGVRDQGVYNLDLKYTISISNLHKGGKFKFEKLKKKKIEIFKNMEFKNP